MVTKPTGRKKGAPPKVFLQDPDRHLIAAAMRIQKAMAGNKRGCSQREAYSLAIGFFREKVRERTKNASGDGPEIAMGVKKGERDPDFMSRKLSTLYKKSARVQKRSLTGEELTWFDTMEHIFEIGTVETKDPALATELMRLAASINETEWGSKMALPKPSIVLTAARFISTCSKDFSRACCFYRHSRRFNQMLADTTTQRTNSQPLLNPFPQATARLGFSRAKLYNLISQGEIRSVKVGRRTFIAETELQRFVAALSEVA